MLQKPLNFFFSCGSFLDLKEKAQNGNINQFHCFPGRVDEAMRR